MELMNLIIENDNVMKEMDRISLEEEQRLAKLDEKKIDKEVKEIIKTKSYVKENVADDVPF